MFSRTAAALVCAAVLGVPAGAQQERCTRNELSIDGSDVRAQFCVVAADAPVARESFTAHGRSIVKTIALVVVAGLRTSRAVDDVDLAPIGIARTLHITLAYRAGAVILEHALALPGAFPVK